MSLDTCVKIVHLDLSGSTCLSNSAVKETVAPLTALKWLSLDGCTGIGSQGLKDVLKNLVHLEYLSLKHSNITLGVLMAMPHANLQHLDLSYCQLLNGYEICYPSRFFLNLKTFIMDGVRAASEAPIVLAFKYLPRLETVSARNCEFIMGIFVDPCPAGFKLLDIRGCGGDHEKDTTIFEKLNSRRDGSVVVRFTDKDGRDVTVRV
ncbi:F-box/LRR-repeat protein 14-like [Ixodes scapularis]